METIRDLCAGSTRARCGILRSSDHGPLSTRSACAQANDHVTQHSTYLSATNPRLWCTVSINMPLSPYRKEPDQGIL